MLRLWLCVLTLPICTWSHVFMFYPTTKITHLDNWQNSERPCKDDHVIFEESKKTSVLIDSSIGVSQMQLPDDGVIYFGDDVVLGMNKNYQCERRKSPEDVFFEPEIPFGSFFNPALWEHDHEPILHMNMVPGEHDEVYMFNGAQMFIEEQVKISKFSVQERYFETWELDHIMHTVEGQFRTLSLICQYVKCPSLENICVEPVQPIGHCCPACGATIDFTGMETDRKYLWEHLLGGFIQNNLEFQLDLNLERLDEDGAPVDYQITVFPRKNGTFDEEQITRAVGILEKVLDRQTAYQHAVFHYEHKISKMDIKLQTGAKIFGILMSLLMISTMIVYILKRDTNLFVAINRPKDIYTGVVWRRGSTGDQIQLLNTNHIDNQNFTSEPEEEKQVDVNMMYKSETVETPKEEMIPISLHEPVVTEENSEVEELPLVEF